MGFIRTGTTAPKALKDLCILDVLAKATKERPLSQEEIRNRLADRYGMSVDRKTLHRHLEMLTEYVPQVHYAVRERSNSTDVMTDFWMERETPFEDSELRALVYLVIFSRHIPVSIKKSMVEKLESLSGNDLHHKMGTYVLGEGKKGDYNALFLNIDELSRAISDRKKVSFSYTHYEADKKLHAEDRTFTVSPLGIGVSNGDFYLVATTNVINHDNPEHTLSQIQSIIDAIKAKEVHVDTYRLDRMKDISILEETRDIIGIPEALRLRGAIAGRNEFDIQEYAQENPELFSGHSVRAEFLLTENARCTITDVIDRLGVDNVAVSLKKTTDSQQPEQYRIRLRTNLEGLRSFALLHADSVEILKPEKLRDELQEIFRTAITQNDA